MQILLQWAKAGIT